MSRLVAWLVLGVTQFLEQQQKQQGMSAEDRVVTPPQMPMQQQQGQGQGVQ
jgi:hypothetical protein